jgi:hypothetical protein
VEGHTYQARAAAMVRDLERYGVEMAKRPEVA